MTRQGAIALGSGDGSVHRLAFAGVDASASWNGRCFNLLRSEGV